MLPLIKIIPNLLKPQERKVVLENFLSLSSLQGMTYLLPVIILPYLVRVIGPERFGLIAFAQSFAQYFMILTDYGFSLSATREISLCSQEHKKVCAIFSSVMTVKLILAIISAGILLLIVNFIPRFKQDWLVFVFSFGSVIGNTLFPVWFFQGKERMEYIANINIACGILYTFSIFIFVKSPADYLYVPLLNSLFFLIVGIWGLHVVFRKFGVGFVFQTYGDIRQAFKTGWNIFISIVAINAYTASRVFSVGLLTNNTLTGYYSIAERIANLIQTFPLTSLSQAVYPRLSYIFLKNKARALGVMRKIQKSTTLVYAVALPILSILTPLIVRTACGIAYEEVVVSLRLMLLGIFFITANAFRVQFLLVCNRTDVYSKLHVFVALLGLPLIFILTRYFSYLGAAFSTIITESTMFILTIQSLIRLQIQRKSL